MTYHRDQAAIDAFAAAVSAPLALVGAQYQHGPMGGHEWRWHDPEGRRWALNVGGAIDAGPLLLGPDDDNRWQMAGYTLRQADAVIVMLQLAGALPSPARTAAQHHAGSRRVEVPPVVARHGGRHWLSPPGGAGPGIPLDYARGEPAGPRRPMTEGEQAAQLAGLSHWGPDDERLTVLGGGGPPEYGSDGVAYEGDRIIPARGYQPGPGLGGPGWREVARLDDDQTWRPSHAVRDHHAAPRTGDDPGAQPSSEGY